MQGLYADFAACLIAGHLNLTRAAAVCSLLVVYRWTCRGAKTSLHGWEFVSLSFAFRHCQMFPLRVLLHMTLGS
jgi:hypothetical protein